jgi:hypothetical protein
VKICKKKQFFACETNTFSLFHMWKVKIKRQPKNKLEKPNTTPNIDLESLHYRLASNFSKKVEFEKANPLKKGLFSPKPSFFYEN